jgi:hypothetical protein
VTVNGEQGIQTLFIFSTVWLYTNSSYIPSHYFPHAVYLSPEWHSDSFCLYMAPVVPHRATGRYLKSLKCTIGSNICSHHHQWPERVTVPELNWMWFYSCIWQGSRQKRQTSTGCLSGAMGELCSLYTWHRGRGCIYKIELYQTYPRLFY